MLGFLWVKSLRLLNDPSLIIVAAMLLPWTAYIGGEALHVLGDDEGDGDDVDLGLHACLRRAGNAGLAGSLLRVRRRALSLSRLPHPSGSGFAGGVGAC